MNMKDFNKKIKTIKKKNFYGLFILFLGLISLIQFGVAGIPSENDPYPNDEWGVWQTSYPYTASVSGWDGWGKEPSSKPFKLIVSDVDIYKDEYIYAYDSGEKENLDFRFYFSSGPGPNFYNDQYQRQGIVTFGLDWESTGLLGPSVDYKNLKIHLYASNGAHDEISGYIDKLWIYGGSYAGSFGYARCSTENFYLSEFPNVWNAVKNGAYVSMVRFTAEDDGEGSLGTAYFDVYYMTVSYKYWYWPL